jgi:lipopolysaccharide/colanic/teichoic acid biosynthesis glycosyltransferase
MQYVPIDAIFVHGPLLGRSDNAYVVSKRVFDLVLACLLLPFLIVVVLLIALAIKLDSPGTVLYYQDRVGYRGRSFRMLKFRTMRAERRQRTIPVDFPDRRRALKVANG